MNHKHLFKKVFEGVEKAPSPFPCGGEPEDANVVRFKCKCGKEQVFVDVLGGDWNNSLPNEFTRK